jgi:hypothetical protein
MEGCRQSPVGMTTPKWPGAPEEKLDRALVAGLMLEVILEMTGPARDPQTHRRQVKDSLQVTMVSRLAGRITLDRFRTLIRTLDHWFPYYYPLLSPPSGTVDQGFPGRLAGAAPASSPPPRRAIREDLLAAWLQDKAGQLLPRRPHGKLRLEKLEEFLRRTRGSWFRLKDLEGYFPIDRKTAWEYLQKFLRAGLLRHNQRRSAAVRYALSDRFLVVRAQAVRQRVAETLSRWDPALAHRVAEGLITTGGEPFGTQEWQAWLPALRGQEVISRLEAAGLLEVVRRSGPHLLVRLPGRWLSGPDG